MKKIYFLISLVLSFVLIAASSGVGEGQNRDRSGSPDGDNVCSQCHSSGAFSPQISLAISDSEGNSVTQYIPGMTYMLSYTVSGAGALEYGFQSTALTTVNENAGIFLNAGAQVQFETVTNSNVTARAVVEHSSPSSSGEFMTEWTAPAAGSGNVTFYYSGVAVNGNGTTSGDGYAGGTTALAEDTESTVIDLEALDIDFTWNNQELVISSEQDRAIESVVIYNLTGQLVLELTNPQLPVSIDSYNLTKGVNVIQALSDQEIHTFKIMN